jgi:hypothetical protein
MPEHAAHVSCRDVVALVTEYLDQAMDSARAELFEQHLNFCDGCVTYVEQMRLTIAAAGRVREDDVPAEARDRLLTAFRHWKAG